MIDDQILVTERLTLRPWRPHDAESMAAINRDPAVTRHLNGTINVAAVDAFYEVIQNHWRTHGFGPWAVQFAVRRR